MTTPLARTAPAFRPKAFDTSLRVFSSQIDALWREYPPEVAIILDRLLRQEGEPVFTSFGCQEAVFPRLSLGGEGKDLLRVGIFGGFDLEPAGTLTRLGNLPDILRAEYPLLLKELSLRLYPIANPLAFTGSWQSLPGQTLRRRLWRAEERADTYYLKRELGVQRFQLLFLLSANPAEPASISASSRVITEEVLQPVLERLSGQEIALTGWKEGDSFLQNAAGADIGTVLTPFPSEIRINYPLPADPGRNLARLLGALLREYRTFLSFRENL
ncbi:hypothetical protein SAMN05444156_1746 [Verrucomicrobium sp. GAS474]|uniref:hypothetical protein n=1 Tax=Verrucomicrobium sp. GAS474 TaxID=1882831 RepID=UPI00087B214B|nr:hypothetical protein [Verrucomicrobium sp. GAS474]SDU06313.1 hypothetical protein SAMN05444156_1746 [Verrucomicrobium sp. GAS474]